MRKHGPEYGHNSRAFAIRYKKRRKVNKVAKQSRKKNR